MPVALGSWVGAVTALVVVEGVAIALLGVLVFGLLRSQAQVIDRLRGPDAPPPMRPTGDRVGNRPVAPAVAPAVALGGPAPPVVGVTPDGDAADVDLSSGPVLLAFLTEGCQECASWWAALGGGERQLLGPAVAVVTPGPSTERTGPLRRLAPPDLAVVMSSEAWASYGVSVASTFVLVTDGRVRSAGRASTWGDLAAIVGRSPGLTPGR